MLFRGLLLLIAFPVTGVLHGQTGATAPGWEEVRAVAAYTPEPQTGEVSFVDLRGNFPPVGEQQMNDCTAWSVAALKGYLEALDQNWKPDHPSRQFSTAFIYNQLNEGKDHGSSPIAASQLLIEKGAALLSHMPYLAGNYTQQPDQPVFNSAARFRNSGHQLLGSGSDIRKALQQNQPVLIGARLTPPFFSGRFTSYSVRMHDEGMKIRRPDQPHALHAMVIVGYDDTRGAFLVRNSWGTQWGNRGYCWVDYAVMERVDGRDQSETFLLLAMTMQDELLPVTRTQDRSEVEVSLQASDPVYDVRLQKHIRRYGISIAAPEDTLRRIKEVTWQVYAPDGTRRLVSSDQDSRFRVWAVGTDSLVNGFASVEFLDGGRQQIDFRRPLSAQAAAERSAQIRWSHQPANPGSTIWRARLTIDADAAELSQIASVEYHYPSSTSGVRTIVGKSSNLRDNFAVEWKLFKRAQEEVFADVTYADGSVLKLSRDIALSEPVRNAVIHWSLRPTGVPELGYAYRVWVEMPRQVASVTWTLDGTQSHRSVYRDNLWEGFAFEGTARHSFNVSLEYRDPSTHSNRGVSQRISLPEDAFTNAYELTVMPKTRYIGKNEAGQPQRLVELAVTGNTGMDAKLHIDRTRANRIEWVDDNGALQTFELSPPVWNDDLAMLPQQYLLTSRQSFPVEVVLYGQTADEPIAEHRFKETIDLGEPPADFIEPLVAVHRDENTGVRWEANFSAAPQARQIRRIVAEYDVPALLPDGKTLEVVSSSVFFDEATAADAPRRIGRALDGSSTLAFQLYYLDGAREAIEVAETEEGQPAAAYTRPGGVRLLERFAGTDAEDGPFVAEFRLEGSSSFVENVEHIEVRDPENPQLTGRFNPGQTLKVPLTQPTSFEVTIHYKNGQPETALLHAACLPQREHELRLIREGETIALVAPLSRLDHIQNAGLSMLDFSAPLMASADPVPWSAASIDTPRFYREEVFDTGSGATYTAEIIDTDGEATEVSAALPMPESTREIVSRYWGKIDGVPHWLVRLPLKDDSIADIKQVRYEFVPEDNSLQGLELISASYPDYATYLLVRCGGTIRATVESESYGTTTLPGQTLTLPPAPAETLSLQVAAGSADQEWLLFIDGPLSLLEDVESVSYAFGTQSDSPAWRSIERFSLHGDGFHAVYFGREKPAGTVSVRFRNGQTELLSL